MRRAGSAYHPTAAVTRRRQTRDGQTYLSKGYAPAEISACAHGISRGPDHENPLPTASSTAGDSRGQRYAFSRMPDALANTASLPEYAEESTSLWRPGAVLVGRCPLRDQEAVTSSFALWSANDSRCLVYVRDPEMIALHHRLHGCLEMREAAVGLALERGVELSARPEDGQRAARRKVEYRGAAHRVPGHVPERRLYRTLVLPYVDLIEAPEEREREMERSWREWISWWARPLLVEGPIARGEDTLGAIAAAEVQMDGAVSEAARPSSRGRRRGRRNAERAPSSPRWRGTRSGVSGNGAFLRETTDKERYASQEFVAEIRHAGSAREG